MTMTPTPTQFLTGFGRLQENVERAIKGKPEVVRLTLTCLLAEGHLLIEDVPGVGKTSLARAIAASIDASWHRIQFTPDLLPSDVTGVTIWNQATQEFSFRPGGVFANIIVADEINRASPKTQSALLEVMEEGRVTIDSIPHPVPQPFMVIATQNPIDMDGTYALPEAQLDRFLIRATVGYPDLASEMDILTTQSQGEVVGRLSAVMTAADVALLIQAAAAVYVAPTVQEYLIRVVAATRSTQEIRLGASPRASLALLRASRAWAAAQGRTFVSPEDVQDLAVAVLAHRIILTPEAELRGRSQAEAIEQALRTVKVPKQLTG